MLKGFYLTDPEFQLRFLKELQVDPFSGGPMLICRAWPNVIVQPQSHEDTKFNIIHLMPFLINGICCIYSFSSIDSSLFDKVL